MAARIFIAVCVVFCYTSAAPANFQFPTWKPFTFPTFPSFPTQPSVHPVIEADVCAILYHQSNFAGQSVAIKKNHDGHFSSADQGRLKSAVVVPGCTLAMYTRDNSGQQSCSASFAAAGTNLGYFTFSVNCQSVKCSCA